MDLSIIIVSWNTRDLLRNCLNSLPQACADLDAEVLVVDNASSDGTVDMLHTEFPAVRVIEAGANVGFSRGNNLALDHADGQAVLLLNPDTVCPPSSLTRLLKFMHSRSNVGAVGPRLVDANLRPTISGGYFPQTWFHWAGFLDPRRLWLRGQLAERVVFIPSRSEPSRIVEYVMGACFLMPRTALETVGPLDEQFFMYFEETDWCLRARQAGLDVWYCAESEVQHLEGQAAETVSRFSALQFQKSYRLFVAKHFGARKVWDFRLAQLAEYGGKALLRSLTPGNREKNQALASQYRLRAQLQLQNEIEVTPPA